MSGLEITKRDLFNTQDECGKAALSPLRFNLYLNDLAFSFDNVLSDPFVLPNGTRLNSLLYADDLIILGTLSKDDDDDGSENVAKKMNLLFFKHNRVYLDPLSMSNAGDFS